MSSLSAPLARTLIAAGLVLASLTSPSVFAQEMGDAPAADDAYVAATEPAAEFIDGLTTAPADEMAPLDALVEAPAVEMPAIESPVVEAGGHPAGHTDPMPAAPAPSPTPTPSPTPVPSPTAAPAPAAGKVGVNVVDNRFQSPRLTVAVGSTVTWTNNGNNAHTLSSADGLFDSGALLGGQTFTYTFQKAGTFNIICRQHVLNGMTAQVIVQ